MIANTISPTFAAAPAIGELLAVNAGIITAWMLLFWGISLPLRNVSIVDIAWGLGFVLVAWATFLMQSRSPAGVSTQHWLLPVLGTIWGCRLSGYVGLRNHGQPEDKRYVAMREKRGGSFWWRSLYVVFLLQGVIMWIVSLPLQLGIVGVEPKWTVLHGIGVAIWGVGFIFETVGDWQMARFKKNPANKGQVLDRGLWRYTRHPNYFGDFCVWWGLFLIADAYLTLNWTIVSPLLMSVLLMKVSGVTLLEQSLEQQKPGYADYIRCTNAFFPGLPKQPSSN